MTNPYDLITPHDSKYHNIPEDNNIGLTEYKYNLKLPITNNLEIKLN